MMAEPPARGGPAGAEEEGKPRPHDSRPGESGYDDCDCERYGPAACLVCRDDWQRRRDDRRDDLRPAS